ncbi:MAG: hypothetical protein ABL957_10590 [Parvularculaceae bacterium]
MTDDDAPFSVRHNLGTNFSATEGGIATRFSDNSGVMVFLFGGMPIRNTAPFQLLGTTSRFEVDRIYLRDLRRAWYQLGLAPYTSCVDDTAAFLCELIVERAPRRVVTVGISAGGFAAMLFGHLLGADEVHAFSPRTYIDIDNRLENDDFFMDDRMEEIYAAADAQPEYFDLKPLLAAAPDSKTTYCVHFAPDRRIDPIHARRVAGAPNVKLYEYDGGGHQLARLLRNDGRLVEIIGAAIAGRTKAPTGEIIRTLDSERA